MAHTHDPILSLAVPADLDDEVVERVASWTSTLLSADLADVNAGKVRHLVLVCGPVSVPDAETMLATAARFLAGAATEVCSDLDALLVDWRVEQWLRACHCTAMSAGTLSNHKRHLNRFLRVRRGLPARLAVPSSQRNRPVSLSDSDLNVMNEHLVEPDAIAAYVAAVGAGLAAGAGRGGMIASDCSGAWVELDDQRYPVVSDVVDLAVSVSGHTVSGDGWERLRREAAECGVAVTRSSTRATFTMLALSEEGSLVELVHRFRLTYRALDDAAADLVAVDPARARLLLRG